MAYFYPMMMFGGGFDSQMLREMNLGISRDIVRQEAERDAALRCAFQIQLREKTVAAAVMKDRRLVAQMIATDLHSTTCPAHVESMISPIRDQLSVMFPGHYDRPGQVQCAPASSCDTPPVQAVKPCTRRGIEKPTVELSRVSKERLSRKTCEKKSDASAREPKVEKPWEKDRAIAERRKATEAGIKPKTKKITGGLGIKSETDHAIETGIRRKAEKITGKMGMKSEVDHAIETGIKSRTVGAPQSDTPKSPKKFSPEVEAKLALKVGPNTPTDELRCFTTANVGEKRVSVQVEVPKDAEVYSVYTTKLISIGPMPYGVKSDEPLPEGEKAPKKPKVFHGVQYDPEKDEYSCHYCPGDPIHPPKDIPVDLRHCAAHSSKQREQQYAMQ